MYSPISYKTKAKGAFALIELLTVIAIVGILAVLIMSVLGRARVSAKTAHCVANLRQVAVGLQVHASEYKGLLPRTYGLQLFGNGGKNLGWTTVVSQIVADQENGQFFNSQNKEAAMGSFVVCPAGDAQRETEEVATADTPGGYSYACGNWLSSKKVTKGVPKSDGSILLVEFPSMLRVSNPAKALAAFDFPQSGNFATGEFKNLMDAISYRHNGRYNVLWLSGAVTSMTYEEFNATRQSSNPDRNDIWYGGS